MKITKNKHFYVSFTALVNQRTSRTKGYVAETKEEVRRRFKASYPYYKIIDIQELD